MPTLIRSFSPMPGIRQYAGVVMQHTARRYYFVYPSLDDEFNGLLLVAQRRYLVTLGATATRFDLQQDRMYGKSMTVVYDTGNQQQFLWLYLPPNSQGALRPLEIWTD